ncbi:hypothetical protein [Nocardioides sp. LHG3406-4]|uniref:hypothetical protein n=1 Tax=Nocardioides sp. LHG3406-4 TaxID=2804575 RepID=UPI003CF0A797
MEFVKVKTDYYLEGALLRAGEAAEVLYNRGMAYAGARETDGFIPTEALSLITPNRGKARAAALVREGIWETTDGGWRIVYGWQDGDQITKEQLEQNREAGRRRQQTYRQRHKTPRNGVRNGVTNGEVTGTEVEEEVDAAAAAPHEPLPPPLEILKAKLEAARLAVRWDRLTPAQHTEIVELIDVHGDGPLVKSAVAEFRPDSPAAFAQAWLPRWRALTPPGTGLRAAPEPPCTLPGHQGTTRRCNQCAAEQKAAR